MEQRASHAGTVSFLSPSGSHSYGNDKLDSKGRGDRRSGREPSPKLQAALEDLDVYCFDPTP